MIQVYSNNLSVTAGQTIPLSNTVLKKGCTTTLNGSTINLNANGVYMVSVDAVGTSATTGDVAIQLFKNGTAVPQAQSQNTIATADDYASLGFTTLVNVNTCRCCGQTELTIQNTGIANTMDINVVVTKVC